MTVHLIHTSRAYVAAETGRHWDIRHRDHSSQGYDQSCEREKNLPIPDGAELTENKFGDPLFVWPDGYAEAAETLLDPVLGVWRKPQPVSNNLRNQFTSHSVPKARRELHHNFNDQGVCAQCGIARSQNLGNRFNEDSQLCPSQE